MQALRFTSSGTGKPENGLFVMESTPRPADFPTGILAYDCNLSNLMPTPSSPAERYGLALSEEAAARLIMYTTMLNRLGIDETDRTQYVIAAHFDRLVSDVKANIEGRHSWLEAAVELRQIPTTMFMPNMDVRDRGTSDRLHDAIMKLIDYKLIIKCGDEMVFAPSPRLLQGLA